MYILINNNHLHRHILLHIRIHVYKRNCSYLSIKRFQFACNFYASSVIYIHLYLHTHIMHLYIYIYIHIQMYVHIYRDKHQNVYKQNLFGSTQFTAFGTNHLSKPESES